MDLFTISSVVIVLAALFGYVNVKFLKLPNTIGLMAISIFFTLVVFASTLFTDQILNVALSVKQHIDLEKVLLDVLLGFLLFAGAMHTNFDQLHMQRWPVLVFSTLGVLCSTLICATLVYFVFQWIGLHPKYIHCLLFGALISPTDPIAVLGILRKANVPKGLETQIVGESLFNDGVGVVVFLTIMSVAMAGQGGEHAHDIAHSSGETTIASVVNLFGWEVLGGVILGLGLGYGTYRLLKSIDDYEIEVMITLACVMGGYSFAHAIAVSAPLAMVVAGLVVGNDTIRGTAMSDLTEQYVDKFWELVDMLLNAVLFVLIGLELITLQYSRQYVIAALLAICFLYTSPSPRDKRQSRMPSSA